MRGLPKAENMKRDRLLVILPLLLAPAVAAAQSAPSEPDPSQIDPSAVVQTLPAMPARGSTMKHVRAKLGEPKHIIPAVGDPPITRWVYDQFTVYFEHNRVIDSVKHREH